LTDNAHGDGASVLVVDDEQIVLNLVEDTLTDEGYTVTTTPSAHEAIDLVKKNYFDFVLTDIRMPEMNGIELIKEIHQIAPTVGVIFMTGYANLDTAKQAIKEGAYDYIMKPFELSEIRQAMARAVQQKQSATEATLSQELNKITGLSNLMYASGDLASLLQLSLSFAVIQGSAEVGVAVYYDRHAEELAVTRTTRQAISSEAVQRLAIPPDEWMMVSPPRTATLIRRESEHPLYGLGVFGAHHDLLLPPQFTQAQTAVIVPLNRSEKALGFLSLFYTAADYELKSSDTRFLDFISSQLAISLENLELLEDSREAFRRLQHLQEQTLQLEKMATRGQMSAEIGHELNNYLGVVIANFQLMNLRLKKGVTEGLDRFTESIEDHLDKISRFTKGLMDYSSLQQATFTRVDINQLLERVAEFLKPQKRFRLIAVETSFVPGTLEAEVDQGLIEQVLYNLLNNAADALTEATVKKIEIGTARISDDMIRLSVRDYGNGIPEEQRRKLFKEKFTTKQSGHGIGLVVCKNIIDKHNGRISVDSVPGQETIFMIDLPVIHQPAAVPVAETV
jgi:signal transduction histidine kinase/CheY-like chemotaxis protein